MQFCSRFKPHWFSMPGCFNIFLKAFSGGCKIFEGKTAASREELIRTEIDTELETPLMAKTRPGKRDADSYTIRGTNKIVKGIFCGLCGNERIFRFLKLCNFSDCCWGMGFCYFIISVSLLVANAVFQWGTRLLHACLWSIYIFSFLVLISNKSWFHYGNEDETVILPDLDILSDVL